MNVELGQVIVAKHLGEMNGLSKKKWPPIIEIEGYKIVSDRAYQGFDNDPTCQHHRWCGHVPEMWSEPRFWCRSIEVRRISDGVIGWGIGPQADAYKMAVDRCAK